VIWLPVQRAIGRLLSRRRHELRGRVVEQRLLGRKAVAGCNELLLQLLLLLHLHLLHLCGARAERRRRHVRSDPCHRWHYWLRRSGNRSSAEIERRGVSKRARSRSVAASRGERHRRQGSGRKRLHRRRGWCGCIALQGRVGSPPGRLQRMLRNRRSERHTLWDHRRLLLLRQRSGSHGFNRQPRHGRLTRGGRHRSSSGSGSSARGTSAAARGRRSGRISRQRRRRTVDIALCRCSAAATQARSSRQPLPRSRSRLLALEPFEIQSACKGGTTNRQYNQQEQRPDLHLALCKAAAGFSARFASAVDFAATLFLSKERRRARGTAGGG
jgi:hypothetical protein